MKNSSKTDWNRVKREAAADAPIAFDPTQDLYNPNDSKAVEAFIAKAVVRRGPQKAPTKAQVAIRFDRDVLDVLKATGRGWQTRVNDLVRREFLGKRPKLLA
jgi:uncharacterized protein (DUF4415 family)